MQRPWEWWVVMVELVRVFGRKQMIVFSRRVVVVVEHERGWPRVWHIYYARYANGSQACDKRRVCAHNQTIIQFARCVFVWRGARGARVGWFGKAITSLAFSVYALMGVWRGWSNSMFDNELYLTRWRCGYSLCKWGWGGGGSGVTNEQWAEIGLRIVQVTEFC